MAAAAPLRALPRPITLAEEVDALAERVARLTITRSDPHAFFAERSDIRSALKRMAQQMRGGR